MDKTGVQDKLFKSLDDIITENKSKDFNKGPRMRTERSTISK